MKTLQNLKKYLKKKNISIPQFAESLGRSKTNLYDIFSGRQKMSINLYLEICEKLAVDPRLFLTENEDKTQNLITENSAVYGNNSLNESEILQQIVKRVDTIETEIKQIKSRVYPDNK